MSKQTDRQWGISVAEMTGDSEGSESQVRLTKCHSDHLQVKDTQSQGGWWTKGSAQSGFPPSWIADSWDLRVFIKGKHTNILYVLSHSWALNLVTLEKEIGKFRNYAIIGYFLLTSTFKTSKFATWHHKHEPVTQQHNGDPHSKSGKLSGKGIWYHHGNKNPPWGKPITTKNEDYELINRRKKMKAFGSREREKDKKDDKHAYSRWAG